MLLDTTAIRRPVLGAVHTEAGPLLGIDGAYNIGEDRNIRSF